MRKPLWISLTIIAVFLGIWCWLASSLPCFWDESEDLAIAKGVAERGITSPDYWPAWNFDKGEFVQVEFGKIRGALPRLVCSLAFKTSGDPVFLCRFVPLLATLAIFLIVLWYYQRRGVLTAGRFLTWTVLFFCSFIVLENSFYIHFYALLAAFMIGAFILYWEGLMAIRRQEVVKAVVFWLMGFGLFWVTVADGWQYQQIPIFMLAIFVSLVAIPKRCQTFFHWLQNNALWLGIATLLVAPVVTMTLNVVPIPLKNAQIFHWFLTYWDNLVGFSRFVIAVNVGLLALGYAFKSPKPLSFDRWIFISGVLGVVLSTLYNPSNQVFFSRYMYFPTVMVIIGLSGMMEEVFARTPVRNRMLALYAAVNLLAAFINVRYEHSNIRDAVQWLNTHIGQDDILLAVEPTLLLNGGEVLESRVHTVYPSDHQNQVQALKDYVSAHPHGKIFYLYNEGYGFRNWLYKKTTGITRYTNSDLFMYLRNRIPAKEVMPGLRQCGLLEFEYETLMKGLDQLSKEGFEREFKAPEKIWIKGWLKKLGFSKDSSSK